MTLRSLRSMACLNKKLKFGENFYFSCLKDREKMLRQNMFARYKSTFNLI